MNVFFPLQVLVKYPGNTLQRLKVPRFHDLMQTARSNLEILRYRFGLHLPLLVGYRATRGGNTQTCYFLVLRRLPECFRLNRKWFWAVRSKNNSYAVYSGQIPNHAEHPNIYRFCRFACLTSILRFLVEKNRRYSNLLEL